MTARWPIDLSPGTVQSPASARARPVTRRSLIDRFLLFNWRRWRCWRPERFEAPEHALDHGAGHAIGHVYLRLARLEDDRLEVRAQAERPHRAPAGELAHLGAARDHQLDRVLGAARAGDRADVEAVAERQRH